MEREEIESGIERLQTLTREGKSEAAEELRQEVWNAITEIKGRGAPAVRQELQNRVHEAVTPSEEDADYSQYAGVKELVRDGAEKYVLGYAQEQGRQSLARQVAQVQLDIWTRVPNKDGDPDMRGLGIYARAAASDLYTQAISKIASENNLSEDEARETAEAFERAVQRQRRTVRVEYLRDLDNDRPEIKEERKRFARLLADKPKGKTVSEYLAERYNVTLLTHSEYVAAQKKGELSPGQIATTGVKRIRKVRKELDALTAVRQADDESKQAALTELEELQTKIRALIIEVSK